MRKPDNHLSLNIFSFSVSFTFCLLLTAYCLLFPIIVTAGQPAQVCFGEQCLTVDVADTEDERMRGLQNRASLPEGEGMLFIFPSEGSYRFWMKETFISLDMIWLDSERKVVGVATDVPPCPQDPCPQYGPSAQSLYVLEASAGFVARLGLKVGDEAIFK